MLEVFFLFPGVLPQIGLALLGKLTPEFWLFLTYMIWELLHIFILTPIHGGWPIKSTISSETFAGLTLFLCDSLLGLRLFSTKN